MWFTKIADGFRGWFVAVQSNGTLRTGLVAGDFTVTVVEPGDAASLVPTVTESATKSGLYRFDVTSGFITTNGVGEYGVVVEIDTFAGPSGAPNVRTSISKVLRVTTEDFDTLSKPGDAMDLVANAVDAAAIATDAIDADAIATDAIGADELATSAVNEIRDSILSDSTSFAGADIAAILADTNEMQGKLPTNNIMGSAVKMDKDDEIDAILADTAAINARLPPDPADASVVAASHASITADIAALNNLAQADILSDAIPFPGGNIDATISSRSDFDETTDPVELLDSGGTAGTSAAELVTDIEANLASNHGAGQWDGTDSDWTTAEREQIRFRLALDGAQTNPTTGTGTLEDILTDTDAIDSRLPSDPADESLQQASHAQTQADIAALNNPNATDIADAVWDEDIVAAHDTSDTAGFLLRVLGAIISQRTNNANLNALLGVSDTASSTVISTLQGPGTDTLKSISDQLDGVAKKTDVQVFESEPEP